MIDMFLKALAIIDGNNEIADWSSPVAHYFNALHEAFSVDDGNGYIYINGKASIYVYPEEDDPDDGDDGDKVGGASVGSTRTVGYVKKLQKKLLKAWKAAKTPEERAKLKRKITAVDVALKKVIDFDNLLEETQRKFNEYVMSRLSEFTCDFFPTTIADLLYLDRQGVSVQAQVYFYSLLMDLDDPMGGADAIKGYKRRLFLNILETAVTAWLRRKGHKLRNSSCLDEWLHGRGFLGRGLKKRRSIKSDFVNHMRAGFRPAVLDRIGKQKMTVDVVMTSWDVPPIIGQPEMFRHGKVMVTEIEHGVGNYENAFTTPASNLPDPDEDGCYNVKNELRYDPKFTDEQCRVARERNIAKVRVCERTGVLTSIDKNDKAWLDNCGTTFVDYLTKTHVPDPTVFGEQPSSFKWAVAFNYKGIYMMELEYDGDDLIRVVVIFCPWCNMFFSKVGTKASAERLASMEFTTDSAQFYHEIMRYFGTENASLEPSTSLLEPIAGNVLVAVEVFQFYNMIAAHLEMKVSVLTTKNLLEGSNANHFGPLHNNMRRTSGDLALTGRSARNHISKVLVTCLTFDRMRMQSIVNAMMKATSRTEMVQIAVSAVKMEGRKSGGDKDKDAKKEDAQQLCEVRFQGTGSLR
mmetsp:Transcript_18001/g.39948  ORF Transcript_18001/g.39948 Transcript_18001/m.39948 type:complete len:634 (+) Transcript_18001:403-2304(+)